MKKKLTTLALTAALALFAGFFANAAEGDIYDIVPCDENGVDRGAWTIPDDPFGSGVDVYFKVRLVAREFSGGAAVSLWRLDYDGLIPENIAEALYPMEIGIYVSGKQTYASLVSVKQEGNFTTALVFKYTTKPGDFAMPIRLATVSGPAGDSIANGAYVFNPFNPNWKMVRYDADNNKIDDCGWLFTADNARITRAVTDIGRAPVSDYSLGECGIYVKTVDFSADDESTDYWRTVHENSTITGGGVSPRLEIAAPSVEKRTFYVWSSDESKIKVKASGSVTVSPVTMRVDDDPSHTETFQVAKIEFEGGSSAPVPFLVEAQPGSEGATAELILSAYDHFNYSASSPDLRLIDYVTATVKCIEALPASIIAEISDTTIIADNDYLTAKTSFRVYLSQEATNDVHVTLKTTFEDTTATGSWGDYVRFSTSENTVQTLPDPTEITFTIPAYSTEPKTVYVYALRGDSHTIGTGHQLKFTPYVSDEEKAAAGIQGVTAAGVWISAAKPVITTPDVTSVYEVTSGEELEINVAVEDTYADMTDVDTGYQVRIKTGSTASWQTLTERFKASGEGGELIGLTSGNPPTVKYSASGAQTSQIQVISPISGKKSEIVQFTVNVTPAKTTSATCLDPDPDNYIEGDTVHFRISLSAQNDTEEPIYAFLLCNGDMDASMFGGTGAKAILTDATAAAPGSIGLTISEVGSFVNGSFTVLDGLSADDAGQNYTFSVVLSKTKEYTGVRMPGYATTEMLNITVYNKEPNFVTVSLNGFEADGDGYTFSNQYPKGQDQTIQPEFDDVSYDLKHGFTYKWTAYRDGQAVVNGTVEHDTTGTVTTPTTTANAARTVFTTVVPDGMNINECPIVYNFPRAGTWTVKIQMKDKDMTRFSPVTYSISFVVLANPQITITADSSYDEFLPPGTRAKFDVGLGYFDSDEDIVVKLTVTPPEGVNPGALVLANEFKTVPAGYPALAANEYYISFDSAQTISVDIDSMDGTRLSSSKGFTVKAEVVSDGISSDPTMTWAEYYTPHETKIYINNMTPEFGYVTDENTNAWNVAGGAADSYPISWEIRNDVDYDFTTVWPSGEGPGIKVSFKGCENETTFYVTDTDEWSGTFVPNFGSRQKEQTVVLTIQDKDGGIQTWTYMYFIRPSKFLTTIPNGPTGFGNSELSKKYSRTALKGGRGEGHLYVPGATFSDGTYWRLRWNCSSASTVDVFAWGYRVGDFDNGWLDNGMDLALDETGSGTTKAATADTTAGFYPYTDATKDSFLYAWLISNPQTESGPPEWTLTLAPEQPSARAEPATAYLPTATTEDESYIPVYAEAVFAKEWQPEDNLGDINQDGIPDYFAIATWGNGVDSLITTMTGGDKTEADLTDLADGNPDEDYIPGVWQAQGKLNLVNKKLASYAPIGYPLNNRLEIRGFHHGLNETSLTLSDPSFSDAEQAAYKAAFKEENNRDWTDADGFDLGFWSPEPRGVGEQYRMDPTMEDTDSDGMPDGWEYFFWYQAKVWAPAARNGAKGADLGKPRDGQLFVFERFNPNDIVRGTEIPAKEVLERFNPCVELDMTVEDFNPDFDGDGLTDLEELLIGTNPCHWDTDGDHMCDGWEVMNGLDPLNGSKVGNPDGDFMAYTSLSRYFAAEIPNADPNAPTTYVFDLGQELREYRDYETRDIEMYAMARYYDDEKKGPYIQTVNPKDANGDDNYPLYYYFDDDNNRRYTVDANDPDAGDSTIMRYTSQGAITIRDVPLASALVAPEKLDATGAPYLYGLETDAPPIPIPAVWHWSYPMLDHMSDDFVRGAYVIPQGTLLIHTTHILVHDQVHKAFGFDPRTGWYKDSNGYVADRWNPQINLALSPLDTTGVAVNTDPYTDYDEYLVMRYRHDFGIRYYDDGKYDPNDIWATFLAFTTKPNIVYAKTDIEAMLNQTNATENATTYDTETAANLTATANIAEYLAQAFAEAGSEKSPVKGHGADTDGDGVPDGWELYKSRNPNAAPSWPTAVGNEGFAPPWDKEALDGTPDYLGYTAEYAGTDSCNAYKDCPSIYNNHPGLHPAGEGFQQGWFNKFFPTDPDNPDTDGDGIVDGAEGMAWRGTWYNGGNGYIVAPTAAGMTFIYGNPQDSITCCVRGGGMNPCTVDTDIDGLPDPWEMQYAGIPVDALTRRYAGPAKNFDPDIDETTFTADGLNAAGFALASNVVYICGGMDATWGGDGWTDPINNGNSTDPLLGTRRDVDFDHDGLQNYQEYLVQQVRHFRYDDITTPLMGRYMDEGEYDLMNPMGPLLSNHVINEAPAFTPMMQDADQFVFTAIGNWGDGAVVSIVTNAIDSTVTINEFTGAEMTNFVYEVITNVVPGNTVIARKYYGDGYNYMYSTPWVAAGWRKNGYMASPIHYWDRMITCAVIQPSIMMPPAGVYVSTDPRLADTDGDGMDDYYEMFHGLNPLLGSTEAGVKDIIALAWGQPAFYNAFWNEWTHPDFNRIVALMGMPGSIADPTPLQAAAALDPFRYPWSMGAGEADPDGDGLRNDSERVTANLTSPMTTHTDPTPLWFTDTSSPASYTAQYYQNTMPVTAMPFWPLLVGFDEDPYSPQTPDGGYGGFSFLYAFEENEGYDTDNDWKSDGHEIITTTRPGSDPLDFSDPARRQALYLDGDRSWVQSRAMFMRDIFTGKEPSATTVDFFKQFTVETWIRPEKKAAQTILDRCSLYGYDAINKNEAAIRSNFRLGLTADGRVYGMFDNDDARDSGDNETVSCQTVDGPEVPLNEWTHVAMTYDGKALLLYVNGIERGRKPTSLIPANGVKVIIQDPTYTNTFTQLSYEAVPGAFFIGGRPLPAGDGGAAAFDTATITYDAMNGSEWFKGYVDEVRIWDGVRTASEISANYARKMTKADASANREEVYTHLMSPNADASRNDNDGKLRLTAELVQLYDFTTLPGAINAADVAINPVGFDTAVRGQLVSKPAAFSENIGWWNACATKSTVYTDYAVMPWIENTVHHLPVMDGSVVDSFLYSDYLGGYTTTATQHELSKYALNNSAMPYPYHNYFLERYQRLFKLNLLAQTDPENFLLEDLVCRYEYEIRSDFIGTADLVPMGGAYSKTCPAMWDGNGVADAWEYTSVDTDADGLPDWWEEKYGLDPASSYDWNSMVDWNGAQLPAYIAYGVDLALGMQPDGEYHPEYASTVDIDADNIPDWWENLFGVAGYGANDDPDNDGLPNYAEYLVSFGPYPYGVTNGWAFISPLNAYSTKADQRVPDYYLRAPKAFDDSGRHIKANEYYGEIVTDHDFMESWWENSFPLAYVNSHVYDPDKDVDGDGWDNWSEARAFMWSGSFVADMMDRWFSSDEDHAKCYPEPALGLRITYNGIQNITGRGIVVRTTTGQSPRVDATFVVPGSDSGVAVKSKIIGGYYSDATLHGFLNPGQLIPGSGRFSMARLSSDRQYVWNYLWYINNGYNTAIGYNTADSGYGLGTFEEYLEQLARYPHIELEDASLSWELFATTVADAQGHYGTIYYSASNSTTRAELGKINYRTGEYSLDVGALASARGESLDGVLFSVEYESRLAQNWPQSIWVSEATTGRVKEGLNTIEVWIDLNADGVYTPGEPYGVVRNVNVGWHKTAETVIELKDTSSTIPRYLLADGLSDRAVVKGISSGVLPAEAAAGGEGGGASIAAAGLTANVVVRRVSLNGQQKIGDKTVPERILVSKTVVLDDRAYLTEADVLSDDKFDLDWKWLTKDAEKLGITGIDLKTAEYEISSVAMLPDGSSTNLALSTFVNTFNAQRVKPAPVSPTLVSPVYGAAPTFTFTSPDDTMTAFRLQVSTSTNASDVVYDSGIRTLPGRVPTTVGTVGCTFTPQLYVNDPVATNGAPVFVDGSNYFWRVTLMNAKYNSPDAGWGEWAEFQMDVANENRYPKLPTGYGKCGAVVRYFGPGEAPEGQVVVEVHRSADFAGQPLAQLRADVSQLDDIDDIDTVNAAFTGIEPGSVYLMAYIDTNNNGRRDVNESWGYANYIGADKTAIYTPKGVTVTDELYLTGEPPKVVIFIEDTDINRNEIPDCLEDADVSSSSAASGDTDRDGLLDEEEPSYATESTIWDTDGDGMPDGWEVKFADLDPNFNDAVEAAEGDVMAFVKQDCTIVTVRNTDGSDPVNYILKEGQLPPVRGDSIDGYSLYVPYDYPVVTSNGVESCYGRGAEVQLKAAAGTTNRVIDVSSGKVVLVHWQVYDEFGFNPRTANPVAFANGTAVNTKEFTALDKYLVIRYLEALGLCSEDEVNVKGQWAQYSLRPFDSDNDLDGIADGWELYVMFGHGGAQELTMEPSPNVISPWVFDDRAMDHDGDKLADVHEYDRGNYPTDPWDVDSDGDGITDDLAWKYHLKGTDGVKDFDGDGLSNYVEYLLAEVFNIAEFSPDDAFSVNPNVSDYFYRLNELYVGEIFTDHDRVWDVWESGYFAKEDEVSPYVYDEMLDPDGDGWSNYSEFQAGTAPTKLGSLSVDAIQMDEYPVPTIELKLSYNGNQSVGDKAVVVKAWRDPELATIPDAVWTLGGEGNVSVTENGNSNIVTGVKYFGMNPRREMLIHLSPGSVVPGSVKFEFKDLAWVLYNELTEQGYLSDPVTALWEGGIIDQQRNDSSGLGDIVSQDETTKSLGTIDYATGEMKVDFASFAEVFAIVGDISERVTGNGWYSIYNLQKSYVRVNWQSKLIAGSTVTTYYLSEADKRSASNNSLGHVKEGRNTFVAFYDLNGDGMYTAGEPYGCAVDVDVGWNYARAEIELTDTHPVSARVCCITGAASGGDAAAGSTGGESSGSTLGISDRQVLWGTEHGDIPAEKILLSQETGGKEMRLRVVRTLIDGEDCTKFNVPARVILDKNVCVDSVRYLTEADFLAKGALDIDWETLYTDLAGGIGSPVVSNVTYRIVMGEGSVENSETNNCVGAFNRWFDSQAVYNAAKPILLNDDAVVTAVSPTFKWAIPSGLGTYTAFRIEITGDGFAWDSGFQRMPSRIMDPGEDYKCHYEWTAPICVDDLVAINGRTARFANDKRYAWRVTLANARFRENWSVQGHFRMNVPEPSQECGKARVAVRYYGPSNVANGSVIRVEAFTTPDFSGEPVSRGYVTNKSDIASTAKITAANATLPGLKTGSYYIRAYIDTLSNGMHEGWESWGCYCTRDVTTGTIYTPKSVTVGPVVGGSDIIPVYIDDCDTDQDCLPDAWEWAENGNLTAYGSAQIDQTATGGFALKTSLAQNLRSGGSPSGGLAVMVSNALMSPRIAAQIVGVDATGTDDQVSSALANASADAEATPVAVAITAITLDRTAGTVSISADTEGAAAGSVASDIYTIPGGSDTLELTCKVMHRDSLDSGDWTVIKTEKVAIEKKSRTYTFNLGSSSIDLSSGFFKVSLEK